MNSRAISLTLAAFVLLACASADSSMSDDTISFSTAQAEVEVQLKAGRSESACYKVASDVKAEVDTACRNAQKMVNDINTGSSCCKTNAGAVTQADSRLKEVQGKLDQCKSALRDAQDTKVSFPAISFKKLKKGKCASFFGGNSYKNAKRKFDNQKRKCNGLQGQVKAFKRGASDAKKAQKRAIQKCLNRTHRTIASTYNTSKKQCNSSANKKTWKRAKHMLCVLNKTPLNKCKVGALPSITKPKTASINCKGQTFSHGAAQGIGKSKGNLRGKKKNTASVGLQSVDHKTLCMHPLGGQPKSNVKLIWHPGCTKESRLMVKFIPAGDGSYYIQSAKNGNCVHPRGGQPNSNVNLIWHPGCKDTDGRLRFIKVKSGDNFYLKSKKSGLCVHPKGGTAKSNVQWIFHAGCSGTRLQFKALDH